MLNRWISSVISLWMLSTARLLSLFCVMVDRNHVLIRLIVESERSLMASVAGFTKINLNKFVTSPIKSRSGLSNDFIVWYNSEKFEALLAFRLRKWSRTEVVEGPRIENQCHHDTIVSVIRSLHYNVPPLMFSQVHFPWFCKQWNSAGRICLRAIPITTSSIALKYTGLKWPSTVGGWYAFLAFGSTVCGGTRRLGRDTLANWRFSFLCCTRLNRSWKSRSVLIPRIVSLVNSAKCWP